MRRGRVSAQPPQAARISTGLVLGGLCFLGYLTNLRPMGAIDTLPARLLPFSIVREHDLDLDEFPWLQRGEAVAVLVQGRDGRWLSRYPVATPLLVTPLAAPAAWWLRDQDIVDDDVRFRLVALTVERVGAALIAALSVVLVYCAACLVATPGIASGLALAYGLGTNTWAISSQALWQHGLAELCLAGLSVCLLGPDSRRRAIAAGGFAALGVAARPTMAVFALLALLYVWRQRRPHVVAFLATPLVVAAALLAYNLGLVAGVVGGYGPLTRRFVGPSFDALLGLLLSPNRGLFIFTPAACLVLLTMLYHRRELAPWLQHLCVGMGAYLLLYGSYIGWPGGNVYGPRFLTDVLPAVALCAAPAVEGMLRHWAGRVTLIALALWGVAVQVVGVYCDDGGWNVTPYTIAYRPARVWDWHDLQIVRAARAGWHGSDLAPLLWQMLAQPREALLRPMQPAALAGEVAVEQEGVVRARLGSDLSLPLRIVNRGAIAWPTFSDHGYLQVGIVSRWWHDGAMLEDVGQVIPLPTSIAPGEHARLRAHLEVPRQPGLYELELSVAQEVDPTHGVFGGAAVRLPVRID